MPLLIAESVSLHVSTNISWPSEVCCHNLPQKYSLLPLIIPEGKEGVGFGFGFVFNSTSLLQDEIIRTLRINMFTVILTFIIFIFTCCQLGHGNLTRTVTFLPTRSGVSLF